MIGVLGIAPNRNAGPRRAEMLAHDPTVGGLIFGEGGVCKGSSR